MSWLCPTTSLHILHCGRISSMLKCGNWDHYCNDELQITPMIDCSLIKLIRADETYKEFSFRVKKAAEGAYITSMFGWDEDVQRGFHDKAWQQQKPDIITYEGKPIGTVATIESEDCIEVGQFFILPDYQNKGIGTYLLKRILDKADQLGRTVTLKFLNNNPVKSFMLGTDFGLLILVRFCITWSENQLAEATHRELKYGMSFHVTGSIQFS